MPHNRFFVEIPLSEGESVDLKDEARHLKVMRLSEGETLELVNGQNVLATATLISKHTARIDTIHLSPPPSPLILCQGLPKLNRLDTIVEKGTELGMTELWLFPGERSEKRGVKLERLEQIVIASMKQCGRLDLPKIVLKDPLTAWETLPYPAYFGDIDPEAPPLLSILEKKGGICFCVGPEAGFSAKEEVHLKELGARGVRLHGNILRTDTASLVALSLISASPKFF